MTFMEVKPAAFLVRKEGFYLKPFLVAIAGFTRQLKICHQEDGFEVSPFPPSDDGHWAIAFAREPDVRDADLIPWAQAQIAERKQQIVFVELRILGSPTDIPQIQGLQSGLEFDPIELAITQEYRLAIFGQDGLQLGEQIQMKVFRQVSFTSFDNQPGDGQSSFAIDQADHQGDTLMPDFTPVDDKDQLSDLRQAEQQAAHKGQVIAFIIHTLVLDPATVAFDPAVGFGMIGCFASNAGQLTTLAQYNATDHRRQCVQHANLIPLRFCRKQLSHRYSNGTIDPTIVTHGLTPVLPWS